MSFLQVQVVPMHTMLISTAWQTASPPQARVAGSRLALEGLKLTEPLLHWPQVLVNPALHSQKPHSQCVLLGQWTIQALLNNYILILLLNQPSPKGIHVNKNENYYISAKANFLTINFEVSWITLEPFTNLSWAFSGYLGLSWPALGYLVLFLTILVYHGLSRTIF